MREQHTKCILFTPNDIKQSLLLPKATKPCKIHTQTLNPPSRKPQDKNKIVPTQRHAKINEKKKIYSTTATHLPQTNFRSPPSPPRPLTILTVNSSFPHSLHLNSSSRPLSPASLLNLLTVLTRPTSSGRREGASSLLCSMCSRSVLIFQKAHDWPLYTDSGFAIRSSGRTLGGVRAPSRGV